MSGFRSKIEKIVSGGQRGIAPSSGRVWRLWMAALWRDRRSSGPKETAGPFRNCHSPAVSAAPLSAPRRPPPRRRDRCAPLESGRRPSPSAIGTLRQDLEDGARWPAGARGRSAPPRPSHPHRSANVARRRPAPGPAPKRARADRIQRRSAGLVGRDRSVAAGDGCGGVDRAGWREGGGRDRVGASILAGSFSGRDIRFLGLFSVAFGAGTTTLISK